MFRSEGTKESQRIVRVLVFRKVFFFRKLSKISKQTFQILQLRDSYCFRDPKDDHSVYLRSLKK